jgi:hypothetical protein
MSTSYPPAEPAVVVPGDLDQDSDMTEEERQELAADIATSEAEFERGEWTPAEVVLANLRRRRGCATPSGQRGWGSARSRAHSHVLADHPSRW